jgi:hypothetical protein
MPFQSYYNDYTDNPSTDSNVYHQVTFVHMVCVTLTNIIVVDLDQTACSMSTDRFRWSNSIDMVEMVEIFLGVVRRICLYLFSSSNYYSVDYRNHKHKYDY